MSSRLSFLGAAILSACAAQGEPTRKPSALPQEVAAVTQHFSDATLRQIDATDSLPEEKDIVLLLVALESKLSQKYASSSSEGGSAYIITPKNNILAVSIQGRGSIIHVNADRYFRNGAAPEGILQIEPRALSAEIYDYPSIRSRREESAVSKNCLLLERSNRYETAIDFHFAGSGYAYGNVDLSKVFEAFGLPPDMDAREKARIILTTLNEQL